jgi:polysaccharide export outer membrane protein
LGLARRRDERRTRLVRTLLVPMLSVALMVPSVAAAQATAPASATAAVARSASELLVGLGDKVVLKVWREPAWSDAFLVDPAGEVVLPRIGRMRVVGMTAAVLEDSVRVRLATYLREPNVDVIVLRRVAVLGAVKKPDVLFVEPVTTLQDVIAQAGGLTEDGDPNRVEIRRGDERITVGRWREVAARPAQVRSGDQVIVGQRNWWSRNALAALSSVAVAASVLLSVLLR